MPSVLVFGATGVVAQFLLPRLVARGEHVIALSRQPPASEHGDDRIEWLRGDLFAEVPPLPAAEIIYSLGPLDAFADWFERAAPAGVHRVIALSSMSAESKQESSDPAERDLAARLRGAEARLLQAAQTRTIACTVFRPTLIYGSGRERSLARIARLALRWRVLPIPYGADGLRQPVHAADLATACLAARENVATFGHTYALGGGERLRFDTLLERLRAALPRWVLPLPVPLWLLRLAARFARGASVAAAIARLRVPLVADNATAARDFGYAPRAFTAQDVLAGPLNRADFLGK